MMRKKQILVTLLVVLAAGYVYRFTDWIVPSRIQVEVTTRPVRGAAPEGGVLTPVFMLDRDCPVTAIEVIALSNVPPASMGKVAWRVSRPPGREPVRGFLFDDALPGAKTESKAQPLIAGGVYRIEVQAGRMRGQREFVARPAVGAASAE
jgi:hypothetical protein